MKLLLVVVLLGGCQIVSEIPTLKYCDEVNYTRLDNDVTITAHCTVPPAGLV